MMINVLIAEDEPPILNSIAKLIHSLDSDFIVCARAKNGLEVLQCLNSQPINIIFTDIKMPLLNGLDATKEIRESSREDLKHIPVIAMTADAFAEDIQRCIDAGMDAHVSKPIEIDKVLTTIRLILSRKNNART